MNLRRTWRTSRLTQSVLRGAIFAAAAMMVVAFAFYSYALTRSMQRDAGVVARIYAQKIIPAAWSGKGVVPGELGLAVDLLKELPVTLVITDSDGNPVIWKGVGVPHEYNTLDSLERAKTKVLAIAAQMDRSNAPIPYDIDLGAGLGARLTGHIHYAESPLLRRVVWMPVLSAVVALLFTGIALCGFRTIQEGDSLSLWVGMAKETAHQLGTPLSSLSGWLEIMRDEQPSKGANARRSDSVVEEMWKDMDRLQRIASRFGQIGSVPELKPDKVTTILDEILDYFRQRMPKLGKETIVTRSYDSEGVLPLNRELLGWAFENLFKNSVDALRHTENDPAIAVHTESRDGWMTVTFSDNGKGMTQKELKKIFTPGYSTKTRGWGLGLTFVKRIVEDYHGGHITATSPGPGSGTTITMRLPMA